jgi:DNA-binding response OmpR family regulator
MRILIAEDDDVSRRILQLTLIAGGHEVISTGNGAEAWSILETDDAPPLAILDWMMPELDGPEVCRRVRQKRLPDTIPPAYIILLTAKGRKSDIVCGLEAGANDYIIKPFDREELRARVQVGETIVNLQSNLALRIKELEVALARIKQLQGTFPICSYCKNIRNDENYWEQVESYIMDHSEAQFTHSICPPCYESVVEPELRQKNKERNKK